MYLEDEYYPSLPAANDPNWKQVAVRVQGMGYIELLTLPDPIDGQPLHACYTGDIISVVKHARFDSWIAAKVGYKIGWLDVSHVNFTLARVLETAQAQQVESHSDWLDYVEDAVPRELLTSEVEQVQQTRQPSSEQVTSKDLNRLVRYLKNLAFGKR